MSKTTQSGGAKLPLCPDQKPLPNSPEEMPFELHNDHAWPRRAIAELAHFEVVDIHFESVVYYRVKRGFDIRTQQ